MNELQLTGQANAEQIAAWKKQYPGGVYAIEVDGHVGYFKNPTRKEMNYAMSKADKEAALDMFEQLAEITYLGGSEAVIRNDELFFGLVQELKVKMDGKKARLVNL